MSHISQRANAVDASGIRKVFDLAAKLKDPINLSIGLPDFDVPDVAKAEAIDALTRGENRYTQTQGIAPLRERLRKDLTTEFGFDVGDVLVTSGVSGGIMLALLATLDPGDECIFLDPYFVMYRHILTMFSGKAVAVDSYPTFRFPIEKVQAAITSRTKILLLNSPSNPTGIVMTQAEVNAAINLARKHDLLIISDEIYEPFLYREKTSQQGTQQLTEQKATSPSHLMPGPNNDFSPRSSSTALPSSLGSYEKTVVLRGFSKSHAMTGWRVGYAFGYEPVVSQMAKLQQYTFVCAPSVFQWAAIKAMDVPMASYVDAYKKKRDMVVEALSGTFEFECPGGAFYAYPKVPRGNATDFCTRAIEHNVLTIPGNVFSARDTHFRISYATTDEKLAKGLSILKSVI